MTTAIIDTSTANIASVRFALERLDAPCVLAADPDAARDADRLILPGAVSGDLAAIALYLSAADVCAVPSRNEGMGRIVVEAMALGVPVVGAAVGGIPAVLGDDEAGRLVPPDDAAALAETLIELAHDRAMRAKLATAGRARAQAFSVSVAEARLLALYRTLARERGLA